jgi:hypothetical protein
MEIGWTPEQHDPAGEHPPAAAAARPAVTGPRAGPSQILSSSTADHREAALTFRERRAPSSTGS